MTRAIATRESSASTTVTSAHGYTLSKSDAPDPVAAGGDAGLHAELVAVGKRSGDGRGDHGCAAGERDVCELQQWLHAGGRRRDVEPGRAEHRRFRLGDGDGDGGQSAAERDDADEQRAHLATATAASPTTASAQTTVNSSHALAITKTGPATVAAGGQITYTLRYTVTGNETATSVTIDDNTPLNTTFASASGSGDDPGAAGREHGAGALAVGQPDAGDLGRGDAGGERHQPAAEWHDHRQLGVSIADTNGGTTVSSSWNTTVEHRPQLHADARPTRPIR